MIRTTTLTTTIHAKMTPLLDAASTITLSRSCARRVRSSQTSFIPEAERRLSGNSDDETANHSCRLTDCYLVIFLAKVVKRTRLLTANSHKRRKTNATSNLMFTSQCVEASTFDLHKLF